MISVNFDLNLHAEELLTKGRDLLIEILSGAFYGSSWFSVKTPKAQAYLSKESDTTREDVWATILQLGGYIYVYDVEEDEDKPYKLTLEHIVMAFKKLIAEYPEQYANIITNKADIYDYDAIIQLAIFDDVIYG